MEFLFFSSSGFGITMAWTARGSDMESGVPRFGLGSRFMW